MTVAALRSACAASPCLNQSVVTGTPRSRAAVAKASMPFAVKAPSLARAAPGDAALDRGLASESCPRSFCQHTNAVRQAYGRNHARNRADLRLVKLLWHGALCRSIE